MEIHWIIRAPNAGSSLEDIRQIGRIIVQSTERLPELVGVGRHLRLEFASQSDDKTLAKLRNVKFGDAKESVTELVMQWSETRDLKVHGDSDSTLKEVTTKTVTVTNSSADTMFQRAIKISKLCPAG